MISTMIMKRMSTTNEDMRKLKGETCSTTDEQILHTLKTNFEVGTSEQSGTCGRMKHTHMDGRVPHILKLKRGKSC